MSFSTPVDVSAWTTATTRASRVLALGVEQALGIEREAPLLLDAHDVGTAAARDFAHPVAEHAVRADDGGVAGLEQVDEAGLHAGRAGAAHREGQRVVGAEDGAQARHRLVHDREELGVHVPEQRTAECGDRFRVGIGRTRSEEQSVGDRHAAEPTRRLRKESGVKVARPLA